MYKEFLIKRLALKSFLSTKCCKYDRRNVTCGRLAGHYKFPDIEQSQNELFVLFLVILHFPDVIAVSSVL